MPARPSPGKPIRIGTKAFETCTAHRTRSVSVMCLLLFSEVRVIVVNPQTPTRTFVNTDLISQDSQPSIFHGSHRVEMLKSVP